MADWRKAAISLVVLAMVAWTAFIFIFLSLLATPAIEGAPEATERARQAILAVWLAGLAVGGVALLGLWRGTFDETPQRWRVRWAIAGYATGIAIVVAAYWFRIQGLLVFAWLPLAAALLMLTAWASTPAMRKRLGLAVMIWLIGATLIGTVWFFAPSARVHFWSALALVSVALPLWWAAPVLRRSTRS